MHRSATGGFFFFFKNKTVLVLNLRHINCAKSRMLHKFMFSDSFLLQSEQREIISFPCEYSRMSVIIQPPQDPWYSARMAVSFCGTSKGLLSVANTQEMIESSSQSLLACEGHSDRGRMELSPSNVGILQACAFVCLYPLIIWKTAKGRDQHGSVGTFAHSARPENSARSHKPRGRDAIAKPYVLSAPRG